MISLSSIILYLAIGVSEPAELTVQPTALAQADILEEIPERGKTVTIDVTNAITIGIFERARVALVRNLVLPPVQLGSRGTLGCQHYDYNSSCQHSEPCHPEED